MSDTDSFIDEVNEEVRRDRFYGYLRRYGWIAVLAILLLVGGAAYIEYSKSRDRARSEALGDAMLAALATQDDSARATAMAGIQAETPASAAVLGLLTAAEQATAGEDAAARETLNALAVDPDVPDIYRQIAQFKALTLPGDPMPEADRLIALEAMAQPGNPLRLLAQEQMALIDIQTDNPASAISRYQGILSDAEVTSDLQQRALQVIVALGGAPVADGTENADTENTGSDDAGTGTTTPPADGN